MIKNININQKSFFIAGSHYSSDVDGASWDCDRGPSSASWVIGSGSSNSNVILVQPVTARIAGLNNNTASNVVDNQNRIENIAKIHNASNSTMGKLYADGIILSCVNVALNPIPKTYFWYDTGQSYGRIQHIKC